MASTIAVAEVSQLNAEYEVHLSVGANMYTLSVYAEDDGTGGFVAEITDYDTASGNEPGESTSKRLADAAIEAVERTYYPPLG